MSSKIEVIEDGIALEPVGLCQDGKVFVRQIFVIDGLAVLEKLGKHPNEIGTWGHYDTDPRAMFGVPEDFTFLRVGANDSIEEGYVVYLSSFFVEEPVKVMREHGSLRFAEAHYDLPASLAQTAPNFRLWAMYPLADQ